MLSYKAGFGCPIRFRVSAGFDFGNGFSPELVFGSGSGFDFGCPDTLSDPNSTHCHPLPPGRGLVGGFWGLEIGVAFAA